MKNVKKWSKSKEKKQIVSITDQNKKLQALTNKDDYKSIYKEIPDRVVRERFDEIKELNNEIDHDDSIYYLNIKYIKYISLLNILHC